MTGKTEDPNGFLVFDSPLYGLDPARAANLDHPFDALSVVGHRDHVLSHGELLPSGRPDEALHLCLCNVNESTVIDDHLPALAVN